MERALAESRILLVGASGGIGRAVARELADRGAVLALTGRSHEALSAVDAPGAFREAFDLTAPGAVDATVSWALQALGRLDGVVCTTGVVAFGPLAETSAETVEEIVLLDLLIPLQLARKAVPLLERGGFVANVSGRVAEQPLAGLVPYSAAKAGVSAAFRALARELRSLGVDAIDLRPPHTETGLADRPLAGTPPRLPVGLPPEPVARRIVDAIAAGEREVDSASFPAVEAT